MKISSFREGLLSETYRSLTKSIRDSLLSRNTIKITHENFDADLVATSNREGLLSRKYQSLTNSICEGPLS
jgi:hypothetical protein